MRGLPSSDNEYKNLRLKTDTTIIFDILPFATLLQKAEEFVLINIFCRVKLCWLERGYD